MHKPKLFIGCVQNEKQLAEKIQSILHEIADVKIWDETFFPGDQPLESLRRELLRSDFALLIVTPDDTIIKKGIKGFTARDNILFELGLFMGVQGPRRALCLVVTKKSDKKERTVLMPSDLLGLTKIELQLEDKPDNGSAIRKACTEIKNAINRVSNGITVNLLPSTALAVGYLNNFVLQVCEQLITLQDFKVDNQSFDLTKDIFDFYIVIPDNPSNASHEGFAKFVRNNKLSRIEIENKSKSRTFPFYVDLVLKNNRLFLFDYPTTLRTVRDILKLVVIAASTDDELFELENREIHNFVRTLKKLLQEPISANFNDNIKIIFLSELAEIYNKKNRTK